MEKLRQVNQLWFVVFPTPGDRIFENGDEREGGGSIEKELGCCGERIDKTQQFHQVCPFIHWFFHFLLLYPCIRY